MDSFKQNKIPYKYFEHFIENTNQSCELGMNTLLHGLHRMRVDNAIDETSVVIELAILEVLLNSRTFCVTEGDLRSRVWSYLTTPALYCTPNLKTRFNQIFLETANSLTRIERQVISVKNGTVHHLDVIFLQSEVLDQIALYAERSRYGSEAHNAVIAQFKLSIACMKILMHAEQNRVKSATSSLSQSVTSFQKHSQKLYPNIEPLFAIPPSSWTTETVLELHSIYYAIRNRRSLINRHINIPFPRFSVTKCPWSAAT